jgi:DedD protein
MEIDDKLKNRLAGAAVITALAVIFLPMLFDDPPPKKGQVVSEVDIPHQPEVSPLLTTTIVPDKSSEVTEKPEAANDMPTDAAPSEDLADNTDEAGLKNQTDEEPSDLVDEPTPVKKKPKAPVPSDTDNKSVEKSQHSEQKSAKKTSTPLEEKKSVVKPKTTTLPSLADSKKEKPALPHLDTAPTLEKHRWFIQVVSLSDQSKATAFKDKLREQGFPATIDSVWIKGKGRVYRLKVGPELDAQRAQSMKDKINQLNNVKSIAIAE